MKKEQISDNHISEKTKYFLPAEMQNCWTVYESLKEGEDSWTVLVKETATGYSLCTKMGQEDSGGNAGVMKWRFFRN